MKVEFIALRTAGLGLFLTVVSFTATLTKVVADVVSLISNEIAWASVRRLEKLSF